MSYDTVRIVHRAYSEAFDNSEFAVRVPSCGRVSRTAHDGTEGTAIMTSTRSRCVGAQAQ
jgi:hypothetical protein